MGRVSGVLCLLVLTVLISLAGLEGAVPAPGTSGSVALAVLAPEGSLTVDSSREHVSGFIAANTGFTSSYDRDECYNITPGFLADHSGYGVFKYDTSSETFILYDGSAYSIGPCIGGFGITSMALADLNADGRYELYYTFSWGSGFPRSQAGYFDPADREVTVFDMDFRDSELMLTTNEAGELCVYSAILNADSFVDFSVRAEELRGRIVADKGKILLKTV